jgi:hypothetical protein
MRWTSMIRLAIPGRWALHSQLRGVISQPTLMAPITSGKRVVMPVTVSPSSPPWKSLTAPSVLVGQRPLRRPHRRRHLHQRLVHRRRHPHQGLHQGQGQLRTPDPRRRDTEADGTICVFAAGLGYPDFVAFVGGAVPDGGSNLTAARIRFARLGCLAAQIELLTAA